jgi:hypothetical protein
VRLLGGYFVFDSPTRACWCRCCLRVMHVRGVERPLGAGALGRRGVDGARAGRELVLDALGRGAAHRGAALERQLRGRRAPGLLRGLADARLAPAIRQLHAHLDAPWTVAQLAKVAALSRSAFFERFTRSVGLRRWSTCSPGAWRSRRTCCAP